MEAPLSPPHPQAGRGPVHAVPALDPDRQRLCVATGGGTWLIERQADLESLWAGIGADEFGSDERIPYWTEIWPASLLLAEMLAAKADLLRGAVCLDLGCGLGLTAIIAASLGAKVIGMDYEAPALRFARDNTRLNRAPSVLWTLSDWRAPGIKPASLDLIWGGDILYESRFYEPLRDLFLTCLKPSGAIWLAEPRRSVSAPALEKLARDGFAVDKLTGSPVPVEGYSVTVDLWQLTKQGAAQA